MAAQAHTASHLALSPGSVYRVVGGFASEIAMLSVVRVFVAEKAIGLFELGIASDRHEEQANWTASVI